MIFLNLPPVFSNSSTRHWHTYIVIQICQITNFHVSGCLNSNSHVWDCHVSIQSCLTFSCFRQVLLRIIMFHIYHFSDCHVSSCHVFWFACFRLTAKVLHNGSFACFQMSLSSVQSCFIRIYPYIHSLWEGTQLCYQLAYVLGKGHHHSPFLHLCGVELANQSPEELQHMNSNVVNTARYGHIYVNILFAHVHNIFGYRSNCIKFWNLVFLQNLVDLGLYCL